MHLSLIVPVVFLWDLDIGTQVPVCKTLLPTSSPPQLLKFISSHAIRSDNPGLELILRKNDNN